MQFISAKLNFKHPLLHSSLQVCI